MLSARRIQAVCSEVAKQLRAAREQQQLSMSAVAERSGLSQQMVSYVERGMRIPTLDTALRMANALEVDLGSIVTRAQNADR